MFKNMISIKYFLFSVVFGMNFINNVVIGEKHLQENSLNLSGKQRLEPSLIRNRFVQAKELCRHTRNVFSVKQNLNNQQKRIIQSEEKAATNHTENPTRPRFHLSQNSKMPLDPSVYACNAQYTIDCRNKTKHFGDFILDVFQKSLLQKMDEEPNYYNVDYNMTSPINARLLPACLLLDAKVGTVRRKHIIDDELALGRLIPKRKLLRNVSKDKNRSSSCVIVSSAGSMTNSRMGNFIDQHNIVMRFNNAPTQGFEMDVGTKTTIRVVNSQVVTKPEFDFINSPLYRNISVAAWDPGKFNSTISEWLSSPDFNLFENYKKFMQAHSAADVHMIDPRSIWNLWKILRNYSKVQIRWNPPSSGFIGLAILLPICAYVDFIEYIPSTRLNERCHYYGDEIDTGCTFGTWHPLAAEKLMAYDMNSADKFSVFQSGVIRIRGRDKTNCR